MIISKERPRFKSSPEVGSEQKEIDLFFEEFFNSNEIGEELQEKAKIAIIQIASFEKLISSMERTISENQKMEFGQLKEQIKKHKEEIGRIKEDIEKEGLDPEEISEKAEDFSRAKWG